MTTNPEAAFRLAPCPFCGGKGHAIKHDETGETDVQCYECEAYSPSIAAWNARAAAPVASAGSDGETGWLIESWNSKTGEFGATWWSLDDSLEDAQGWTKDSTIALRFARKADAQAYIDNTAWTEAKPTEHRWHEALAALAASGEK